MWKIQTMKTRELRSKPYVQSYTADKASKSKTLSLKSLKRDVTKALTDKTTLKDRY